MSPPILQMNPESLPPGTVVGGCWRLLERLGAGGYGAVYKVEAVQDPGRPFALKLARHPFEPRSTRELTLLMDKAVHPHVVAVHACGRWPDVVTGHFFFVMDWVPGPALHHWADRHNPTLQQLVDAASRLALILDALHAGGVLHRDLKPEHILMRAEQGDPVLIDLGSGDYVGAPTLTTGPLPPGTLHLRSPEAIRFHQRHRRLDVRYTCAATDDLYALGVCLYRALTGHYPFSPEWPPDVLCAAIASQQPLAPSVVNPRVPPALGAVILRLLEKAPELRFQTGAQLHGALAEVLSETPGEARAANLFEWHEPPQPATEGVPARPPRVRRPEWPTHAYRPPSVARAKVLRLWARLLGVLNPPPKPTSQALPSNARVENPTRRIHAHGRLWSLLATLGLALVALAAQSTNAVNDTTMEVASNATTAVGQKLASPAEPSHTATAASPPPVGPTSAVATPSVASPQEAAAVKKTDPAPGLQAPEKTPRARIANSLIRTAATAAACAGFACASTPPRLEQALPPADDCPPGAVEAMKKLGFGPGRTIKTRLTDDALASLITVREGRVVARPTFDSRGVVARGTEIYGQFYIGKQRVHGRFTQMRMKDVQYPMCLEIYEINDRQRGTPRQPGGDAQNAIIVSRIELMAVDYFDRFEE
ncbi:protein kinase [Pyxidicoccus parkwayensis]|uniref:Protein kinase n=1 Tax=Pyxidicoccus parkwayensis TaxID=2813578 RepID=A0ABX7NX57_9BACT|nr:serine/threonine-protein kinase [Pyxidicoccus parkwaysis]QSQ22057.1 protein kinase [Pyxidicoccus parkwaysis]